MAGCLTSRSLVLQRQLEKKCLRELAGHINNIKHDISIKNSPSACSVNF